MAASAYHILAHLQSQLTSATATIAGYDANDANPNNEPIALHRRNEAEGRLAYAVDAYELALKSAVWLDSNPLGSSPAIELIESHARLLRLLLALDPHRG